MSLNQSLNAVSSYIKDSIEFLRNYPCFVSVEVEIDPRFLMKWDSSLKTITIIDREDSNSFHVPIEQTKIWLRLHSFNKLPDLIKEAIQEVEIEIHVNQIMETCEKLKSLIGRNK